MIGSEGTGFDCFDANILPIKNPTIAVINIPLNILIILILKICLILYKN